MIQVQSNEAIADRESRECLVVNVLIVCEVQALQSQFEKGAPSKGQHAHRSQAPAFFQREHLDPAEV